MPSHRTAALQLLLLSGIVALTSACEAGFPAGAEPHGELNFLDMGDQPKLKPQRADLLGRLPNGMLAPPVGALAIDEHPYPYAKDEGDLAGAALANPLPASPEVLAHGAFVFERVCITCHGPEAAGDGELTHVFPAPPSLMTRKVRDWPDGRIFHVPMRGQGSMPSQLRVVTPDDIWAVVHHLRALQARLPVAPPTAAGSTTPEKKGSDI